MAGSITSMGVEHFEAVLSQAILGGHKSAKAAQGINDVGAVADNILQETRVLLSDINSITGTNWKDGIRHFCLENR